MSSNSRVVLPFVVPIGAAVAAGTGGAAAAANVVVVGFAAVA